MSEYLLNSNLKQEPDWSGSSFSFLKNDDMLAFHRCLPGYKPTELKSLPLMAGELGIDAVYVKDESSRFGIKAFKALGASYAIYSCLKMEFSLRFGEDLQPSDFTAKGGKLSKLGTRTFCAATDGNHGKAVAWTARMLGQRAVIYMPADSAVSRIASIEAEGATIILVEGTFDDCVSQCDSDAHARGWQVLSDTAYEGYMEIPKYIMLGYSSLFAELEDSIHYPAKSGDPTGTSGPRVDLVLLQAGVGGLAAAGVAYYVKRYGAQRPRILCVEPESSDCFLESAKMGWPSRAKGAQNSVMAGLNCGVPSLVAWPVINDGADAFLSIEDEWAFEAMRGYAREGVVSGESGAAGLAGLLALFRSSGLAGLREHLKLGVKTRVLLINTEGDTDPENYRRVLGILKTG